MKKMEWKLKDVIMMAVLGVLFAAVYLGIYYAGIGLTTILTPFGLSQFGFDIIYGVWFMGATIAAYVLRKPGAALITEVFASFIELLLGNAGGAVLLLTGVIQGVGSELGFAVFRYKRYNLLSMSLAGMLSALLIFIYELYYLQYYLLAPWLLGLLLLVRFGSAILFSGVISKLACDGLARTGVLKSYPIGAIQKEIDVDTDEEEQK